MRHARLTLAAAAAFIAPFCAGATIRAQQPAVPKHPVVCARGVAVYHDIKEVPTPFDSVVVPPAAAPVRVSNEAEAEAAELDLKRRAGSVGATSFVVTEEREDDGSGMVRLRRAVQGLFVRADSARAQQACAAK